MDKYLELLKKNQISTYLISEKTSESVELFFIKKSLDMRRINKVQNTTITVFRDFEDDGKNYRGMSDVIVSDNMTEEEVDKKLRDAYFAAGFVKNPYYELVSGKEEPMVEMKSDMSAMTLEQVASKAAEALFSEDKDGDAFINSAEIFAVCKTNHIRNSKGINVSYKKYELTGEFVAQCVEPQDVETYQNFDYANLAMNELKQLVKTTLQMTKDRAVATKMPKTGEYSVILSDKFVDEMMDYYRERGNVAYVYPGYSSFKVNDNVQGEDVVGDQLNITFGVCEPYSAEGITMKERAFITNGKLMTLHGGTRFSSYMGIETIGNYELVKIPAGKKSMEELKKGKTLHVVNFSDFQMDSMSGHFGGEIRLAYLTNEDGSVERVTGGSVNGVIFDAQKNMEFSKDMQERANYIGPRGVLLHKISVAGE